MPATTAKPYHAAIAPSAATGGATQSYAYTITNDANQPLGSAEVTIPSGWSASGAAVTAAPAGKSWTASVNSAAGTIEIRSAASGDRLAEAELVTVSFTGTAPEVCSPTSSAWTPRVKQSNRFLGSGNDFFLTGGVPTVLVGPGPTALAGLSLGPVTSPQTAGAGFGITATAYDTCGNVKTDYVGGAALTGTLGTSPNGTPPTYGALTWAGGVGTAQVTATRAETGRALTVADGTVAVTSNTFDVGPGPVASLAFTQQPTTAETGQTISPAVTVAARDAFGNAAVEPVSLGIGANPGGGTLADGEAQTPVAGTATFAGLSIDRPGADYTLVASAGSVTTTSAKFDIVDDLTVCTGVQTCTTSASNGAQKTDTSLTTDALFAGEVLTTTFLTGPDGCAGSFTPVPGTAGTEVAIVAGTGDVTTNRPVFRITFTVTKATLKSANLSTLGASQFDICLGASSFVPSPTPWTTKSGSPAAPDGNGFYWGLVPSGPGGLPAENPYIQSKHKDRAGNLVIVLVKPYPWDGKGFVG